MVLAATSLSEAVAGPSLKGIKGQIEIDEWSNLWKRDKVRKSVHRGWRYLAWSKALCYRGCRYVVDLRGLMLVSHLYLFGMNTTREEAALRQSTQDFIPLLPTADRCASPSSHLYSSPCLIQ